MKRRSVERGLCTLVLAGAALTPRAVAAQYDTAAIWSPIRQVFGAKGEAEDGYLRFEFPRKDLSITIGTQRLAPEFELTSYMGFVPAGTGRILAMGEVILTDAEAGAAVGEARAQGGKAEAQEGAQAQGKKAESAWSAANTSLGKPEKAAESTAEWEFQRREPLAVHGTPVKSSGVIETASEVVMQRLAGGKVATTGELYLLPQEIDAVSQALGHTNHRLPTAGGH